MSFNMFYDKRGRRHRTPVVAKVLVPLRGDSSPVPSPVSGYTLHPQTCPQGPSLYNTPRMRKFEDFPFFKI